MFHRQRRLASWAVAGLSRQRLWWWRLSTRHAARWAVAAGVVAFVGAAFVPHSGLWPLQRTVSAFCFPYEASVPRTWRVVPGPPSSSVCGAGPGSLALRVPASPNDVVLIVQAEGPSRVSEFLGVFANEHTSRSGVKYAMLVDSNSKMNAAMVAGRQVYTMRCESGAEASCRVAMTRLLDGSRFVGQPPAVVSSEQ